MAEKFKCSFCGQEFDDPVSRAQCEIKCDGKRKVEAEKIRREKLKSERDNRVKEIEVAYDKLYHLCNDYEKDYGVQWDSAFIDFGQLFDGFPTLNRLFR